MKRSTDPKALKRELKAKSAELRADLARRKAAARAELARLRPQKKTDRRRSRSRWLLLLLLLLLLILLPDCEEPAPLVVAPAPPPAPVEVVAPEPAPRLTGRVARQPRPAYQSASPAPLSWIRSFRMQVAARSPRLSACFVGASRPGTLKWTSSVEPSTGKVSQHSLEPVQTSETLSRAQRDCVLAVLSDPPYTLQMDAERATPSRVGMVIEF